MTQSNLICVGAIKGVHGVRGQVRVISFTEEPEDLFAYAPLTDETGARVFDMKFRGIGNDHYIASIEGVTTREAAEALKGTKIFVARDVLPQQEDGAYYHADLIGLEARDEAGKILGRITDVHDYGAGTFLEILPEKGKSYMLPFKDAFVPTVDIAGGFLVGHIPEGWLAEDKPPKEKPAKGKA